MIKLTMKHGNFGVHIASKRATRFVLDRHVGTVQETQAIREAIEPNDPVKRIEMALRAPCDWPPTHGALQSRTYFGLSPC